MTRAGVIAGMMGLASLVSGCGPLGGYVTPDGRRVDANGNPWRETPGAGMAITSIAYRGASAAALGRGDVPTAGKLAGMGIITDEARNWEVAQAAGGNNSNSNNNSGNQQMQQQQQVYVAPSDVIGESRIEFNASENNERGIYIISKVRVETPDRVYQPVVYFETKEGEKILGTRGSKNNCREDLSLCFSGGQFKTFSPSSSVDVRIFIPDSVFLEAESLRVKGKHELRALTGVWDYTNEPTTRVWVGRTNTVYFEINTP